MIVECQGPSPRILYLIVPEATDKRGLDDINVHNAPATLRRYYWGEWLRNAPLFLDPSEADLYFRLRPSKMRKKII